MRVRKYSTAPLTLTSRNNIDLTRQLCDPEPEHIKKFGLVHELYHFVAAAPPRDEQGNRLFTSVTRTVPTPWWTFVDTPNLHEIISIAYVEAMEKAILEGDAKEELSSKFKALGKEILGKLDPVPVDPPQSMAAKVAAAVVQFADIPKTGGHAKKGKKSRSPSPAKSMKSKPEDFVDPPAQPAQPATRGLKKRLDAAKANAAATAATSASLQSAPSPRGRGRGGSRGGYRGRGGGRGSPSIPQPRQ